VVIRGGGAPEVHVPLSDGGNQRPSSDAAEVGWIVPEPPRERSATLEHEGRSGLASESVERRGLAFESVGAKQSGPEQGSSDRLVKRVRICSSM
jgi:hypothetical protein